MKNLPDILTFFDGKKVENEKDWDKRKCEIKEYFYENVYGFPKTRPDNQKFEQIEQKEFESITRETVKISFSGFSANFFIFKDKTSQSQPRPFFIYNMHPYQKKTWGIETKIPPIPPPGESCLPIKKILGCGFNLILCDNEQFAGDDKYGTDNGIFKVYKEKNPSGIKVIGAWSFGISRIIDYIVEYENPKNGNIAVGGHSRGGKTALLSAINDGRIKFAWSCCSGCTGAAIARGNTGETIAQINKRFPYWFCDNYQNFNNKEEDLKADFHALVAAVSPALVYVSSASDDAWACPENEFLSARLASKVYENIYKTAGLTADENPELDRPYHEGNIGYHIKKGVHSISEKDWEHVLAFLKKKGW